MPVFKHMCFLTSKNYIGYSLGVVVQLELKGAGSSGTKKAQKAPAGKGKGGAAEPASGKRGGRVSGTAAKRKR